MVKSHTAFFVCFNNLAVLKKKKEFVLSFKETYVMVRLWKTPWASRFDLQSIKLYSSGVKLMVILWSFLWFSEWKRKCMVDPSFSLCSLPTLCVICGSMTVTYQLILMSAPWWWSKGPRCSGTCDYPKPSGTERWDFPVFIPSYPCKRWYSVVLLEWQVLSFSLYHFFHCNHIIVWK